MPLFAVLAVMLCTAMVLVVWSVMSGFVMMLINSGRTMTGDVVIRWPNAGFAYYDELIADLEKRPEVHAAAPMIEAFGLVALPDGRKETVTARGIVGESFARVTKYYDILHWRSLAKPLDKDPDKHDPRLSPLGGLSWDEVLDNGKNLRRRDERGQLQPAMVPGIEVSGFNYRDPGGYYIPVVNDRTLPDGSREIVDEFLPRDGKILLSLAPLDASGKAVEMVSRNLPIANEFQSGVFEVDERVVLIPLDVAQDMLMMNAAKRAVKRSTVARDQDHAAQQPTTNPGEETFDVPNDEVLIEEPARVTHILIRGKEDVSIAAKSRALKSAVEETYTAFAMKHAGKVPGIGSIRILTWEEQNATMISAVKKETVLLLVLFMIISVVAVFLILAIFWSMVAEKTKDIGILRAVGASSAGVAGLWVAYGLAIGLVGSSLGVLLSYLIVNNINPIHDWLGSALNITIWDPRIYYFTVIPNQVETDKAVLVFLCGVFASGLGAFVPAVRAAVMDPVRALRFE